MDAEKVRQLRLAKYDRGDSAAPPTQGDETSTQSDDTSTQSEPAVDTPGPSMVAQRDPNALALQQLALPAAPQTNPSFNFVCITADDLFKCFQRFQPQDVVRPAQSVSPELPDIPIASSRPVPNDSTTSRECPSPEPDAGQPSGSRTRWTQEPFFSRFSGELGFLTRPRTPSPSSQESLSFSSRRLSSVSGAIPRRSPSPSDLISDMPTLSRPSSPASSNPARTEWDQASSRRSLSSTSRQRGTAATSSSAATTFHSYGRDRSPSPTSTFQETASYFRCPSPGRRSRTGSSSQASKRFSPQPSVGGSSLSSGMVRSGRRSPSPSCSFLDRQTFSRSQSPTAGTQRRSSAAKAASCSFAAMLAERSPASSACRSENKPETSADDDESWPERFPDSPPQRRRLSPDPDFQPKQPQKKRGRPRKNKEETSKTKGNICPICRDVASGRLINTPCGHFFHEKCLKKWFSTPGQVMRDLKTCPSCGKDFDPDKSNPIYLS